MCTAFLKRFGENLEKMFQEFFFNATFSNSNRSSTTIIYIEEQESLVHVGASNSW